MQQFQKLYGLILAGFLFSLVSFSVLAQEKYILVTDPFPPFSIVEGDQISGIAVDIVREAFRRANRPLKINIVPWKRALENTKIGLSDGIFTIFRTEERTEYFLFSTEILGNSEIVLMAKKNSDITFDGTISSVSGETIAVPLGYNAGPILESAFETGLVGKILVPHSTQGLRMLQLGRIKLLSDNRDALLSLAKAEGILDQLTVLEPPLSSTPFHIGYSKVLNSSMAVRGVIDTALHEMWADGTIKNIYAKYTQ